MIKPRMFHEFNQAIIKKNWSKIQEGPLKRAGLLTRKIMRGSIRRAKRYTKTGKLTKPRKPPNPPRSVNPRGKYDFKKIFSYPNPRQSNVIIGHEGFGQRQTPMEVHEFGQMVRAKVFPQKKKGKKKLSNRQREAARKKYLRGKIKHKPLPTRLVKLPKRPFARPAGIKAQTKLPSMWRNSFRPSVVNQ